MNEPERTNERTNERTDPDWRPPQTFEWEVDDPDSAEVEVVLQDWDRFWGDVSHFNDSMIRFQQNKPNQTKQSK